MTATIQLTFDNDIAKLSGILTRVSVPILDEKKIHTLLQADKITFDLAQIEQVDTAGLAWLCALLEQSYLNKCQLTYIHFPEQLLKLATLSGVNDFLPIEF